jgi:hypothetical protein
MGVTRIYADPRIIFVIPNQREAAVWNLLLGRSQFRDPRKSE